MLNTLKMLKPLIADEMRGLTLNELALMYQETHDCRILATSYSKIYKLAISISNNFWGLSESDLASFCLEKLDYCLLTYKPDFQFTTYFSTIFRNKLREETEALNYKKRKCILVSINELINIGIEDTYDILEMFIPSNLTDREYKLCKLESIGYDKKDCAKKLGVSTMTICNMEKSLRNKFNCLQN